MTYTTSITPGRYSAEAVTSNLSVYTATVALTRPSNTTAYTAGDVIGAANTTTAANAGNAILTFPNVGGGGGAIRIDSVDLFINNTTVPSGMDAFRLHLYSIPPTAILDNAAFDLTSTDVPRYLGFVTLALPVDIGSTLYSSTVSVNKVVRMLPYSETLFGVLETRGGYTPASGTLYTVKLNTTDVDEATTGSENLLWAYAGGAVPTLDLEFARTKTLNNQVTSTPPVTFTRASTATFVGSNGLIQTAAVDEPRFDHNPATGESLGLLVEEARTNLYTNSFITKTGGSALAYSDGPAAPDPSQLFVFGQETTENTEHFFLDRSFAPALIAYSFSVYAKQGSGTRRLYMRIAAGNTGAVEFNLDTGAASSPSGVFSSASMTAVGGGVYRCSGIWTAVSTSATVVRLQLITSAGLTSYTGDGTSGINVWGAQLEAGAFSTSYIPTTTATVTRAADVAQITGTNFSQFYNQTEGTLFLETIYNGQLLGSALETNNLVIDDGSGANRFSIRTVRDPSSAQADVSITSGSVTQLDSAGFSPTITGTLYKRSIAYALNNTQPCVAGVLDGSTDTSFAVPVSVNRLAVPAANMAMTIRRLTYWPTRFANTTNQQITTP